MNNSEWDVVRTYRAAMDMAKRNGFYLDNKDGKVLIKATTKPYVDGVTLEYCNSFREALKWLQGYEQHIFETLNS